jgi:chromosome segregation protein
MNGEIVTAIGITQGGSNRSDEGGMIGKRDQREHLQGEIAALTERLAVHSASLKTATDACDAIHLKPLAEAVKSIEREMNSVEMRLAQLQFEKRRAGDVIAKNRKEIESLTSGCEELKQSVEESEPELQALKDEKADVERRMGGVSLELAALENEWNRRSKLCNDLGIRIATLKGEHQNAYSDLKRADDTIADIALNLERRERDIRQAREDAAVAAAETDENSRTLAALQQELAALEARRRSVEDESAHIREEIHRIELRIKDERRSHDESLNAVHELELKIADLRAKADHVQARAREEFEVTIDLKTYPDDEFVDFAALRGEIQVLKEKIKSLGNINFAAFEEYNSEKERYQFLVAQRKDLLEAEKTLLATIDEINSTAQQKFLNTFALIRSNFIQTFKSLFDPGDECDLKLEDGVDPLEARIEIIAKPRGKRPTSIDLLSGGEKTLTATALLFAIYLVKPSPFCILDEVDAPLDDANIDRFTRILHKFSDNTQFIVVTHNKRTMESARALYGVTMEEEGVSKLVAVRFNQGSMVQSATLVSG